MHRSGFGRNGGLRLSHPLGLRVDPLQARAARHLHQVLQRQLVGLNPGQGSAFDLRGRLRCRGCIRCHDRCSVDGLNSFWRLLRCADLRGVAALFVGTLCAAFTALAAVASIAVALAAFARLARWLIASR